ncbi:hypothetical protein MCAMS1_01697 [biofilm metagenome]
MTTPKNENTFQASLKHRFQNEANETYMTNRTNEIMFMAARVESILHLVYDQVSEYPADNQTNHILNALDAATNEAMDIKAVAYAMQCGQD